MTNEERVTANRRALLGRLYRQKHNLTDWEAAAKRGWLWAVDDAREPHPSGIGMLVNDLACCETQEAAEATVRELGRGQVITFGGEFRSEAAA